MHRCSFNFLFREKRAPHVSELKGTVKLQFVSKLASNKWHVGGVDLARMFEYCVTQVKT